MFNRKNWAQPETPDYVLKNAKFNKRASVFESPYNLRSKTHNRVPTPIHPSFTKNQLRKNDEGPKNFLRRSKRIQQKNKVPVKIYDCVSDYYMQMQKDTENQFQKIDKKSKRATFCEALKEQLSHMNVSFIKTRCLNRIKTIVNNINVSLDAQDQPESTAEEPPKIEFFRAAQRPNIFDDTVEGVCSPEVPFEFQPKLEQSFCIDKELFYPKMPVLKNPSPLKFYPRMMHNL